MSNVDYISQILQDAAYTGSGAVADLSGKYENVTFYSTFSNGAAAGVVSYEAAPSAAYAGVWAVLGTENFASNACKQSSFVGAHKAVRARITTDITASAAKAVSAVDRRIKAITAISKAAAAVVTVTGHGYTSGDTVRIVAGDMVELTTGDYVVTVLTADTFSIPVNSTAFTTYTTGGTAFRTAQAAKTITAISKAANAVITVTAHGFVTGDSVTINPGDMVELPSNAYTITVLTADTFSIPLNSTGFTTYTTGGTARKIGVYAFDQATVTATAHGFSEGAVVVLHSLGGSTELNDKSYTIEHVTTNTFELRGVDGRTLTAYTTGGTATVTGTVTVEVRAN